MSLGNDAAKCTNVVLQEVTFWNWKWPSSWVNQTEGLDRPKSVALMETPFALSSTLVASINLSKPSVTGKVRIKTTKVSNSGLTSYAVAKMGKLQKRLVVNTMVKFSINLQQPEMSSPSFVPGP